MHTKKYTTTALILILTVAFLSTSVTVFAAPDDTKDSKKEDKKEQRAQEESKEKKEESKNSPSLSEIIKDIVSPEPAKDETATPVATSTEQATTTPSTTEPKDDKPNTVEEVLNTVIPPRDTPKKNTTASTTVAGTTENQTPFQRLLGGIAGTYTPGNYYSPLDTLSPTTTYALSFCAMVMGIVGAVCILRDPREATVWAPEGIQTANPLLKP